MGLKKNANEIISPLMSVTFLFFNNFTGIFRCVEIEIFMRMSYKMSQEKIYVQKNRWSWRKIQMKLFHHQNSNIFIFQYFHWFFSVSGNDNICKDELQIVTEKYSGTEKLLLLKKNVNEIISSLMAVTFSFSNIFIDIFNLRIEFWCLEIKIFSRIWYRMSQKNIHKKSNCQSWRKILK